MVFYTIHVRGWWNWQTRQLEGLLGAISCRFNSCPAHQTLPKAKFDPEQV